MSAPVAQTHTAAVIDKGLIAGKKMAEGIKNAKYGDRRDLYKTMHSNMMKEGMQVGVALAKYVRPAAMLLHNMQQCKCEFLRWVSSCLRGWRIQLTMSLQVDPNGHCTMCGPGKKNWLEEVSTTARRGEMLAGCRDWA
jgi:hypothetical protein